ncbi:hypothetical protein KY361_06840 [Candidatus Woesearchaeota archaeon]|nr:hypothetical protein [Candidatus Woesearchaeota archaeon]
MSKKNPITSSIKQSLALIKKHKNIALTLLILQIIFLGLMIGLQMNYQLKAFEAAQEIMDYLGEQDLSDIGVAEDIVMGSSLLGDDPLMISRNYRKIVSLMASLAIYSSLAYLLFGSLSWALTDQLIHKKGKKKFLSYMGGFCVLAIGFWVINSMLIYSGLKAMVARAVSGAGLGAFSLIYLVPALMVFYFMFISFALISKIKFKDILRKALMLGAKKANIMLLVYLINLVIIVSLSLLVHLLRNMNLALLSLGLILWVSSFVWARLFLVLAVDRIKV